MTLENYWQTLEEPDYLTFEVSREAELALDDLIEGIYPDYQNRSLRDFLDFLGNAREYLAEWNVNDPSEVNEILDSAEPTWFMRAIILRFGEAEAGHAVAAHPHCPQDWALWFVQRAREQHRLRFPLASFQYGVLAELILNPRTTPLVLHALALYFDSDRKHFSGYGWEDFIHRPNLLPETLTFIVNSIIADEKKQYPTGGKNDDPYLPNVTFGKKIINHPNLTEETFTTYLAHNIELTGMFSRDLGYYDTKYARTVAAFLSPGMKYRHLIPQEAESALLVKAAYA